MNEAVDLPAYIRSNFFRGEEKKALAAVSNIAGIAVPAAKPTLNLQSAVIANAAVTAQVDALKQQAQEAAQQHQQQALAATVATTTAVATEPAATTATTLTPEEEDSVLAELNSLV